MGWLGSLFYLISYFLLSNNTIDKGKVYYLLNIFGALFITIVSIEKNTAQPIVINIFWLYISGVSYFGLSLFQIKLSKFFLNFNLCLLIVMATGFLFYNYSYSFNILAWGSVLSFLGSFYLFSIGSIKPHSFHFYNAIAAFMIIPQMLLQGNSQVVFLEAFWLYFALSAYYKNQDSNNYICLAS